MKTNNYIKLSVVQVRQLQNGIVFTGKMKFSQLNQVYKLTERREKTLDPFDNSPIDEAKVSNEFQRQLSIKKLKEIQHYLFEEIQQIAKKKSLGMFPSSVILYNRYYEIDDLVFDKGNESIADNDEVNLTESIIDKSYNSSLDCCFYIKDNNQQDLYTLYIPNNPNSTLIVDGQHRFFGTKMLFDSLNDKTMKAIVNDFEFIITYLVGFDIYEVGQIFATVNFNQKPVNRSLYYDIFGSAPQTDREGNLQNDIRLAHDLTVHLNNNQNSPIESMIKLLGKGYGLFSQAFFVFNMLRVFRTGIWNHYLIDYINQGNEYRDISKFMKSYFQALQECYPSAWPEKISKNNSLIYSSFSYEYILCKTTGLGAYFRLIKNIYPVVKDEPDKFKENIKKVFSKLDNESASVLFSKRGPYGGSGSEGLQDKLYKHLLSAYDLA